MLSWQTYAKAICAALVAGLTALGTALTDGGVSPSEMTVVAVAFLTAFSVVWAIPNRS
jgi:hypothetical protein